MPARRLAGAAQVGPVQPPAPVELEAPPAGAELLPALVEVELAIAAADELIELAELLTAGTMTLKGPTLAGRAFV